MKIDFVRTGGFAGLRVSTTVDTESLNEEMATKVQRLVADARFYEISGSKTPGASGPDRFEYRLQVSSAAEGTHSIVIHEPGVPDELRPLLTWLTAFALRAPGTTAAKEVNP
jgi:hypothetical protein